MKITKKLFALALAMVFILAACGGADNSSNTGTDNSQEGSTGASGLINVVSREDGSGTRGAFVEIVGVVDENDEDATSLEADIQNGTGKVIAAVAGDDRAIGYISLGSLNDDVKAIKVDGVEATEENVLSGEYKIQRPLLFVYKSEAELSDVAKDYLAFALSKEGQDIAIDHGYVTSNPDAQPFIAQENLSGTISVTGSTSVGPLATSLAEAYKELNPNVNIEIQETGSGAGIKEAMDGVNDIGMSSRELKEDETLAESVIAKDGIAVIVSPENPTDNLTLEQIKEIYLGNIVNWDELAQ